MELKLCPFCGGEANLKDETGFYTYFFVECKKCKASTNRKRAKEEAVNEWNKRTECGVEMSEDKEYKALTRFASIKAMSIDEMVDYFYKSFTCYFCERRGSSVACIDTDCKAYIKRYLEKAIK